MVLLRPMYFGLIIGILLGTMLKGLQAQVSPKESCQDEFVDVLGDKFTLPTEGDCLAIVLIFVGYDCPISNSYTPEIMRIWKEYGPKKVAFCLVYADADLTPEQARKHAKEYGYPSPAIVDPEMKLARQVGATIKPEVAILSPKGELLYRGRINDLYTDFSKKRLEPTNHDLKNALNETLAGKPVSNPRTKAIGCYIDYPKKEK